MIILDTNVLSEVLNPTPSETVMNWLAAQDRLAVFITAITQAELLYGIEMLPAGKRQGLLSMAVKRIFSDEFPGRIPFRRRGGGCVCRNCGEASEDGASYFTVRRR